MSFLDGIDAIAKRLERFVSGSAPSDPLYVTNRTFGQRIRTALLFGVPALAIGGMIYMGLGRQFDKPGDPKPSAPLPATGEITAKVLPHLEKTYQSESDHDVSVSEATVAHGSDSNISGKLKNNTDRMVVMADVVFDVTDEGGSALGAVMVRVENIAAHSTVPFRKSIEQHTARGAVVREIHVR